MTVRYCGRYFTPAELDLIQGLIKAQPTREAIARAMCAELNWIKPDGLPKVMSAKVVLLRMHRDGLIVLPPPKSKNSNVRRPPVPTPATDPQMPITGTRKDVPDLCLRRIRSSADSRLWNKFIERYHYLGYVLLPGAQMRYFITNLPIKYYT